MKLIRICGSASDGGQQRTVLVQRIDWCRLGISHSLAGVPCSGRRVVCCSYFLYIVARLNRLNNIVVSGETCHVRGGDAR